MSDPITRIIFRRGTESERTVVFNQGEPAYATDSKRLYVGDGITTGGLPVGTRFLGFVSFGPVFSNVSSTWAPASGDLVYDTNSSFLYALTGGDYTLTAHYRSLATSIVADEITITNDGGFVGVKPDSLDASHLNPGYIGTGLTRTGNTLLLATPSPELSFSGDALQISNASVANTKLAVMGPDTVKGRLVTAGVPEDITLQTLANVLAPILNTSSLFQVPIGTVLDYAGASAPTGYLLCDGSAVSRTTYASLFAAIGTAYGPGNGTTTFNLPDFRGRGAIGAGQGSGLSNRSRGTQLGAETHTLSVSELPAHNHSVSDPGHAHGMPALLDSGPLPVGLKANNKGNPVVGYTTNLSQTNIVVNNAGNSSSHNNMQPSLVVNKIIKH